MPTLEGAFVLHDRVTKQLIGMRKEAQATDKQFELLGKRLDEVGSRRRVQGLQNVSRSTRQLGLESENATKRLAGMERGMRRANQETQRLDSRLRLLGRGLKNVASDLWKLGRPAGMIYGVVAAIGLAGQAIGSLAGGAIALAPRLLDMGGAAAAAIPMFAGLFQAMNAVKGASKDLGAAMQGGQAGAMAMRRMGHEGAMVVRQLRAMRGELRSLHQAQVGGVFRGLRFALPQFRQNLPVFRGIAAQMSSAIEGSIREASSRTLGNRGFMADLQNIGGTSSQLVRMGGSGLTNIVDSLRQLGAAVRPLALWLGRAAVGWTAWIDKTLTASRVSGNLGRYFARIQHELKQLFEFLGNTGHALRRLFQDARPAGEMLYNSLTKASEAWRRMSDNTGRNVRLTKTFLQMAEGVKVMARLFTDLGAAIFRMGGQSGLPSVARTLDQMIPALEKVLNRVANTFGPPLARLITNAVKLFDQLAGPEGPLARFVDLLARAVGGLDRIVGALGPLRGALGSALEVGLLLRFASRLGLITLGWNRVAAAAGEAAIAERAAMGGASFGPLMVGAGPLLGGGRGRGGGGRRAWLSSFRGRPWRSVAAAEGAGGQLSMLGAGGAAAGAGRLSMIGGGVGRLAGAAGRIALPLAVLSAGMAAVSAQRSGSFMHQAAQTYQGAANAVTLGGSNALLGALGMRHNLDTPEQRSSRVVEASQRIVAGQIKGVDATSRGIERMTRETDVLRLALRQFASDQTDSGKAYRESLQQEIAARRAVIATLRQEAGAKGAKTGGDITTQANRAYQQAGGGARGIAAGNRYLFGQLRRHMSGGVPGDPGQTLADRRNSMARLVMEQGLLAANPRSRSVANRIVREEAMQAHRVRISGGQILTGTAAEQRALAYQLSIAATPADRQRLQLQLRASLEAAGLNPWQAKAYIGQYVKGGYKDSSWLALKGVIQPRFAAPGGIAYGRAAGGRLGGRGLQDTVPVPGGMAAPGELVVNRHTERRVNNVLAPHGLTLGGAVHDETRRHSSPYAQGGRASYHGLGMPNAGIAGIGDLVLGQFPGLSVTSTTAGNHAHGSYHYKGMAIDIGGPQGTMDRAGRWIQSNLGGSLLEGIHNSTLSVKDGKPVSAMFWGGQTWAGHRNHIHLASSGGGRGGVATGAAAGGGAPAQWWRPYNIANVVPSPSLMGLGGLDINPGAAPGATNPPTGQGAGAPGPGAGARYTKGQLRNLAAFVGFPGWSTNTAAAVALAESSGLASNRNVNTNGSIDRGLWQINSIHGGLSTFDPLANARAALQISGGGTNWKPWVTYNTGAYRRYLQQGGRYNWGGWNAGGLDATFNSPTLIGVGDHGKEHVQVTPARGRRSGGVVMHNYFSINGGEPGRVRQEIEAALHRFADELERHYGSDVAEGTTV